MPYIRVETSSAPLNAKNMLFRTSAFVAEKLGKDERWVMVSIVPNVPMVYGASSELAAYVRLESIGLKAEQCPALAASLCDFLQGELAVSKARMYIHFVDLDARFFGWNGKTFGK
ncbi:MAG: hypothetical protein HN348_04855 [Proteobacteria bacterium]|nr:hypothetical protein [Pseudomonadota bacterium]